MNRKFTVTLNMPRILPAYIIYKLFRSRKAEAAKIDDDLRVWTEWKGVKYLPFFYLFVTYPEFRSVFYRRIGRTSFYVKWLCKPLSTLYLITPEIGGYENSTRFCYNCQCGKDWKELSNYAASDHRNEQREKTHFG